MDPGKTTDRYSGEVISNIFEGLVRFKKNKDVIEPWLAKKWELKDGGKKWIFYIRQGIYFHNGTSFDADDVVYSFKKRTEKSNTEYKKWELFFPYINEVTAVDKYTVKIELNKPFAPFLTALTDPVAYIVPTGAYDKSHFEAIGTGPFKFEKWVPGKYLIMERNNKYWEREIQISKVIFKIVPNPTMRMTQLKYGNAHVLEVRSAYEYAEFVGNRDIDIISNPPIGTFYLAFNTKKKPFKRVEVRKAFSHLIDKKVLMKQIFQNTAIPAVSPLPPEIMGFNSSLRHPEFNIKIARQLLKQAGYQNGFSCNIHFLLGDVGEQKIVDAFIRNAKKVNINIIKKPYPFNILFEKIKNKEHDLLIRGWTAGPDPDIFLYSTFTMKKGNSNWAFYENKKLSEILQNARVILDKNERIKLYEKAQEIINREVPWIPLYHLNHIIVHKKNVNGIYLNSNSNLIFKDTYIKKIK